MNVALKKLAMLEKHFEETETQKQSCYCTNSIKTDSQMKKSVSELMQKIRTL